MTCLPPIHINELPTKSPVLGTDYVILDDGVTTYKAAVSALSSGSIGGSIAATQIAFGSGTNTIAGDAAFIYAGGGIVGINNSSPVYNLDINGLVGNSIGDFVIKSNSNGDIFFGDYAGSGNGVMLRISDDDQNFTFSNGVINFGTDTVIKSGDTGDFDGQAPVVSFRSTQGFYFAGTATSPAANIPIAFGATGVDSNGVGIWFRTDGGNIRFDGGKFSAGPADFGIDQPGISNGGIYYDSATVRFGINNPGPLYTLDVQGSMRSYNSNIDFLKVDPDNLYACFGDRSGSFGNNDYIEIDDNNQRINIHSVNLTLSGNTYLTDQVSFFGATAVGQQGNTVDLGVALSNLGIRGAGTAYPITTSGTVNLGSLTASKPVFTDASKNLVSGPAVAQIVASANVTAQTATNTSITTYTTPNDSTIHSFRVGGYVAITAISAGTLTVQISFTDENNTAQTLTYFAMGLTSSGLTTTGFTGFAPFYIRCKNNTAITYKTSFTGVSITYDAGGTIESLY